MGPGLVEPGKCKCQEDVQAASSHAVANNVPLKEALPDSRGELKHMLRIV